MGKAACGAAAPRWSRLAWRRTARCLTTRAVVPPAPTGPRLRSADAANSRDGRVDEGLRRPTAALEAVHWKSPGSLFHVTAFLVKFPAPTTTAPDQASFHPSGTPALRNTASDVLSPSRAPSSGGILSRPRPNTST